MMHKIKEGVKRNQKIILLLIAIILLGGIALYLFFFSGEKCGNIECFQNAMKLCTKANLMSEEPEASWLYEINGLNTAGVCEVNVRLLQAKEGELGIDRLNGLDMVCTYPRGVFAYPEKDLSRCHGRLREELQTIIINKLHAYVIENLGQINESLSSAI